MKAFLTILSVLSFFSSNAQTQPLNTAILIQDVTAGSQGSNPRSFTTFNNSVYFLSRGTRDSLWLYRSTDLTDVNTKRTVVRDSIVSDIIRVDSINTSLLWFVIKPRTGNHRLSSHNGTVYSNQIDFADLDDSIQNNLQNIASIDRMQVNYTVSDFNSILRPNVNMIIKRKGNLPNFYTEYNLIDNFRKWSQTYDSDFLQNAISLPTRRGWFFLKNIKTENEKIKFRDDNAQGSACDAASNCSEANSYIMAIGAIDRTLLYFSKKDNNTRFMRTYTDNKIGDGIITNVTGNLGLEVNKPGIVLNGNYYFEAQLDNGIWLFNTLGQLKRVIGFTNALTSDSLTIVAGRLFARDSLSSTSEGIYEIKGEAATRFFTFTNSEKLVRFIDLNSKPYVITKQGLINTLYRINSNSLSEIGKVNGIDMNAGYVFFNNNFVYSGNNSGNIGQEPYKLSLVSTCDNDISPPIFTNCPTDITVLQNESGGAKVTWIAPIVSDNCTPSASIMLSSSGVSGSLFSVGMTPVTYKATDTSRRTGQCSFKVTVTANPCVSDLEKPKLTCPNNIITETSQNCLAITWNAPTVSDNCGVPTLEAPKPYKSGDCIPLGTFKIIYFANDLANNRDSCFFIVTVNKKVNRTFDIDPTIGKMTVQPNPTEGALYLSFENQKAREMTFYIMDAVGKQIWNERKTALIGHNQIHFDVKSLPAGLYFIQPFINQVLYEPIRFVKF